MTETRHPEHPARHWLLRPGRLFQALKYAVYALLIVDLYLFLRLEWAASDHTFSRGVSWSELAQAFSAAIDTGAWVALLLAFELQTYVIPEEKLRGRLAWTLNTVLAVSYALILWAFYGYCAKTWQLYDVSALVGTSGLCDLPGDFGDTIRPGPGRGLCLPGDHQPDHGVHEVGLAGLRQHSGCV